MALLFHHEVPQRVYWDRKTFSSVEDHLSALSTSTTLYVGNLSFYTTEIQIHAFFSQVGPVRRVIMGLDRVKRTPCGFCFVEYFDIADTHAGVSYLSGTSLDERIIRAELDPGFRQGRQFGRGAAGGQVRDGRLKQDPGRPQQQLPVRVEKRDRPDARDDGNDASKKAKRKEGADTPEEMQA